MLHSRIIEAIIVNKKAINALGSKEIIVTIQAGWEVLRGRVCLEILEQGRESPEQVRRKHKEERHGQQKKSN